MYTKQLKDSVLSFYDQKSGSSKYTPRKIKSTRHRSLINFWFLYFSIFYLIYAYWSRKVVNLLYLIGWWIMRYFSNDPIKWIFYVFTFWNYHYNYLSEDFHNKVDFSSRKKQTLWVGAIRFPKYIGRSWNAMLGRIK